MMQGNLAPNYKIRPKHRHNQYQRNDLNFKLLQLHRKRVLKGSQSQLDLNKIEKDVLIIGLIVMVGLMFMLVSTKVTDDVYQHQVMSVNANISKFHNLNNNSRQRVSELQRDGRLQKVARQGHLTFSSRAVRNVK